MQQKKTTAFESSASTAEPSLVLEFFSMLRHNKKYWLIPIVLILLGFGFIVILGGAGGLAPFIYTLF